MKKETVEQAVIRVSLPVHESFEPFIFNGKPDKPLGWDESIQFAQSNYCSLDPRIDNTPRQMREKAISAWSFQAGSKWREEQSGWIRVEDELPETNSTVLVVANGGSVFMMYYGLSHRGCDDWFYDDRVIQPYMMPTHWQPLPKNPIV